MSGKHEQSAQSGYHTVRTPESGALRAQSRGKTLQNCVSGQEAGNCGPEATGSLMPPSLTTQ